MSVVTLTVPLSVVYIDLKAVIHFFSVLTMSAGVVELVCSALFTLSVLVPIMSAGAVLE